MVKWLLCSLLVLLAALSQGQTVTLYAIPPNRTIKWETPGKLTRSTVHSLLGGSRYKHQKHFVGHVVVELSDSTRYAIVGMAPASRAQMNRHVSGKGYGLGIVFAEIPGVLETGATNITQLLERYPTGDVAFAEFSVSRTAFDRMWQYIEEYQQRGYNKIYNGGNKPREGQGAGCSAFGASVLEVGGVLSPAEMSPWTLTIDVPGRLMGGPYGNGERVNLLRVLFARHWADTLTEPYRRMVYYEPNKMYQWIVGQWSLPDEQRIGGARKAMRMNAKGIVMDCRRRPVPADPIWINRLLPH